MQHTRATIHTYMHMGHTHHDDDDDDDDYFVLVVECNKFMFNYEQTLALFIIVEEKKHVALLGACRSLIEIQRRP